MTELIDTHLGPYQLVEIVGRGGMSIVFKAYQARLERFVAVKVLLHSNDELFTARFKREALSIAQLQHPNILPIFDFGEHNGRFYLVMPCVENGTTLADTLGRPMEPVRALRLIKSVLAALDYAHARGIVHRDIKPGNVLMPSSTWPMLADFGIAKLMSDSMRLTMSGTIIGTAAYMAPEQATGEEVDARADLYATGIMLYELLTGRVPFDADTPIAMLLKHTRTPPPPPRQFNEDLPAIVETVLLRALEKNPGDRYQNASAMAEALEQAAVQVEREMPTTASNGANSTQVRSVGGMEGAPLPVAPIPPPVPMPDQRPELYQNGLREFRAGHWDLALEHLNRLIALDPSYEDAPRLLKQIQAAQAYAQTDQQRRAANLPPPPEIAPQPATPLATACPKCSQPIQPGWTVCPVCSTSLTEPKKAAGLMMPRIAAGAGDARTGRGWLVWAIAAVVLLVVGLGAWSVFGAIGSPEPTNAIDSVRSTTTPARGQAIITTAVPATSLPSAAPTEAPATSAPATAAPTEAPATSAPTEAPATSAPTEAPATSAPTATPQPDALISTNNMNLRAGPSTLFQSLGVYAQNTALRVLGRTTDGAWFQVQLPDDQVGWMLANILQVNLPSADIPVVESPPIPTLTPVPTPRPRPTAVPTSTVAPTAPPPPTNPPTAVPPTPEPPTPTEKKKEEQPKPKRPTPPPP